VVSQCPVSPAAHTVAVQVVSASYAPPIVNFLSTGVDALTLTETPTGDVKITPALVVSSVLYVLDGKMTT
jgi:hypothetical protein